MKIMKISSLAALPLLISACGGSGISLYTVSGNINGLSSGDALVLENAGLSRSFSTNGIQSITAPIADGTAYAITVRTQPTGKICTISNGTGTIHGNVSNIAISCLPSTRDYATVSTMALTSALVYAEGIAADTAGNLYIADMLAHTIRKVTPAGTVTTLAGSGNAGSADGTGTAASFNDPSSLAVDSNGNVYVADTHNNMIRKITPDGVVSTVAGSTTAGNTDGTGTAARFWMPSGIATDAGGNIYVADGNNNTIRKITQGGVVTTLAGNATIGHADGTGTSASFNFPRGIAVDSAGNVFVADFSNNMIRKITPGGLVSTIAGSSANSGYADGLGTSASFSGPHGLTMDANGHLYVVDNDMIRKITPEGLVSTLAGSSTSGNTDGALNVSSFTWAQGITINSAGTLFVVQTDRIRKID